jgi:hypothetical protein
MGPEAYHTCADLERGLKVESTTLLFCTAYDPVWVILDPKPSQRTSAREGVEITSLPDQSCRDLASAVDDLGRE